MLSLNHGLEIILVSRPKHTILARRQICWEEVVISQINWLILTRRQWLSDVSGGRWNLLMNETKSVLELVHKTRLILLVCIVIDRISCFWQMHKLLKFHLIVITRNRLISLASSILGRTEHTLANIVGIFVLFIRSYLVLCGEIQMQSVLDRFLLQETSRISTSLFKNGFVRTMLPLRGKREQIITLSELVFAQELLEEVGLGCYLLVCSISSKSASLKD